jgi:hypothetical protein
MTRKELETLFYSVAKLKKTNISHLLTLDFKNFPTWVPFYSGHSILSSRSRIHYEKLIVAQIDSFSAGSVLCSEESDTDSSPESDECRPHNSILYI